MESSRPIRSVLMVCHHLTQKQDILAVSGISEAQFL